MSRERLNLRFTIKTNYFGGPWVTLGSVVLGFPVLSAIRSIKLRKQLTNGSREVTVLTLTFLEEPNQRTWLNLMEIVVLRKIQSLLPIKIWEHKLTMTLATAGRASQFPVVVWDFYHRLWLLCIRRSRDQLLILEQLATQQFVLLSWLICIDHVRLVEILKSLLFLARQQLKQFQEDAGENQGLVSWVKYISKMMRLGHHRA